MKNIMIDLETMGIRRNSLIIAVGAVYFEPDPSVVGGVNLGEAFYENIDWKSGIEAGMGLDVSTVKWWMTQSEEARKAVLAEGESLEQVLLGLVTFIEQAAGIKNVKVWGNGSTFDISLLEYAYDLLGWDSPWQFWNVRDCRTVEDLATGIFDKKTVTREGTAHHALDDAKHQATYVSRMINMLLK